MFQQILRPLDATLDYELRRKASDHGSRVFLTNLPDGRRFTYGEMERLTRHFGAGLLSVGVESGDHVAILMDNSPEQLISMWGVIRAGFIAVPLNTAAKGSLLSYFLEFSDSKVVIIDNAYLERLIEVIPDLPRIALVICVGGTGTKSGGRIASEASGNIPIVDWAGVSAEAELLEASPRPSDLAMLMFTSGTTGPSKAIMMSHTQVVYWGADVALHHEYTEHDVAYVYLPLFHGNAFLGSTMGSFMAGSAIVLTTRFSITRFWSDIRENDVTVVNLLGSIVNFLWSSAPSEFDAKHKVRRIHAAPVPGFAKEFEKRFNTTLMSAYALTDFGLATYYNTKSPRHKLGSVGVPRANVELQIVDENDIEVERGVPGEIVLRHNFPFAASLGYYKSHEATAACRRNFWMHTGDRGYVDLDGYIYFTDRLKDAIRRRGENISAFEVEEVIRTHPAIEDVAVYPVTAISEDEVSASIVLKDGAELDPVDLIEHCNRNLAYFMVPRYIVIEQSLPRTNSQKIKKHELRAYAEANLDHLWDREAQNITLQR